jgi:hypothetical protein
MMFACFAVFLPAECWSVYEKDKGIAIPCWGLMRRHHLHSVVTLLVAVLVQVKRALKIYRKQVRDENLIVGMVMIASFLTVVWPFVKGFRRGDLPHWQGWTWSIRSKWMHSFYLLLAIFGMNPYLGLRTAGTFSMFSNIRTEGPRSNHLLLGSNPIKFWDFQEDIIYISDIDERTYSRGPLKDHGLPRLEFEYLVREWKRMGIDVPVIFVYREKEYAYLDITMESDWLIGSSDWRYKFFNFRKIQLDGEPNRCRW